jgi:zinc-finger of transposase IS204/IS1001/IS1096/IS1165
MYQGFVPSRLVPSGFVVEQTEIEFGKVIVSVHAGAVFGACPSCGVCSCRVQSRYWRQACDLPMAGRRVVLKIMVRRFWCDAVLCGRRIFAERFGDDILAPLSRRTGRMEHIVHHLGSGPIKGIHMEPNI